MRSFRNSTAAALDARSPLAQEASVRFGASLLEPTVTDVARLARLARGVVRWALITSASGRVVTLDVAVVLLATATSVPSRDGSSHP